MDGVVLMARELAVGMLVVGREGRWQQTPISASLAWSQVEDTGLPALEPEASLAYPMATHSEQPAFPVFSSLPSPPHPRRPGGCSSHCPGLSRRWPLTVLVSQE